MAKKGRRILAPAEFVRTAMNNVSAEYYEVAVCEKLLCCRCRCW